MISDLRRSQCINEAGRGNQLAWVWRFVEAAEVSIILNLRIDSSVDFDLEVYLESQHFASMDKISNGDRIHGLHYCRTSLLRYALVSDDGKSEGIYLHSQGRERYLVGVGILIQVSPFHNSQNKSLLIRR